MADNFSFHEVRGLFRISGLLRVYYLACIRRTRSRDDVDCTGSRNVVLTQTWQIQTKIFQFIHKDAEIGDCIQTGTFPPLRCTWRDSKPGPR